MSATTEHQQRSERIAAHLEQMRTDRAELHRAHAEKLSSVTPTYSQSRNDGQHG